jgi:hypothetical protein
MPAEGFQQLVFEKALNDGETVRAFAVLAVIDTAIPYIARVSSRDLEFPAAFGTDQNA